MVGSNDGRPIYPDNVAEVTGGPRSERDLRNRFSFGAGDPRCTAFANRDLAAVKRAIAKEPSANSVFMADETLERIAQRQLEM